MKRPTAPRIPPVDGQSLTASQRAIPGITVSNVMRTLVRHEELLWPWLTLAGKLGLGGALAPRDRELVILRVALRTDCEYAWGGHAQLALGLGASEADIRALSDTSVAWSDADAALLGAVDELCSDDCVSDETWAALAATRDHVELIHILALIGFYRMNAGMLNSMGVQPEPGRPRLREVPSLTVASSRQSPPRPSATGSSNVPTSDRHTGSEVSGTWHIVFHHPTGDQDLTLVMHTGSGRIAGSVTNPALAVSVQIVEGTVDGNRFSFRAPLTGPVQMEIDYQGSVAGDAICGDVTVQGGGTFPFEGQRG